MSHPNDPENVHPVEHAESEESDEPGIFDLIREAARAKAAKKAAAQRRNYIPTAFRRKSFLKRLPEWWAKKTSSARSESRRLPARVLSLVRVRLAGWFLCLLGFVAGGAATVLFMRERMHKGEVIVETRSAKITDQQFHHRLETIGGPSALNELVNERLLLQYARSRHALPNESDIRARVNRIRERPGADLTLQRKRLDERDLHDLAQLALAQEHLFGSASQVTDADIEAYYREQSNLNNPRAEFCTPERIDCSIIVTPTEDEIRKAWQEIQGGKSFEQAAREHSKDRTAQAGGAMDPIYRGRTNVARLPGFESAAFALQPGELMPPRRLLNAWIILRCRQRFAASTQPFESVQEQCRNGAMLKKSIQTQGPQVAADYAAFRSKAKIQVFWDQYYGDLGGKR